MTLVSLLLFILIIGLGGWGFHHYRLLSRRVGKLKNSLMQRNRQFHTREEAHQEKEAGWEESEAKLRRYLLLMDTLINTISNPIYFKDKDGVYHGCNRVYSKQILGVTRDRIIGRRPQDLRDQIPSDLAAIYQREEAKVASKKGPHTFEAQVQRADGQRRDFLFSIAPVTDRQGELTGTVAVLSDLTDKNRAARDRMQKEKLEGVLETAGAVCHEMNQPLQAFSGYTEILAVQLKDPKARSYIEKLTAQIERMRDITNKLQGITRVEVTDYAGDTKIIDIHKSSASQ